LLRDVDAEAEASLVDVREPAAHERRVEVRHVEEHESHPTS